MKQGYKQTDIGLIPEDWDAVPLLSKCDLLNGLTYTPDDVVNNGLLVLRSSNIQHSKLVFLDNVFVNLTVDKKQLVKKNDIIICVRNGSANLIGKCAKAEKDYNATFGAFMAVLRGVNNDYIYQILQQGTIQKLINKNSDSTINQITNGDFKSIKILFPAHKNERSRIAEVLSDVDELIASLEKLIEKKKALKQGVMQELLTGKRRLAGFTGEWKKRPLGKCGHLIKDSIDPQMYENKRFSEYSMPAFDTEKKPDLRYGAEMLSNRIVIDGEVLLYNKLNVRQKRIWYIENCSTDSICSSEFLPYCSTEISLKLLAQILQSDETTTYFVENSTGTSNSQKRITPTLFLEYEVLLPEDKAEQTAIANLLENFDMDILQTQKRKEKICKLKSGMMSELLTGRIRLV